MVVLDHDCSFVVVWWLGSSCPCMLAWKGPGDWRYTGPHGRCCCGSRGKSRLLFRHGHISSLRIHEQPPPCDYRDFVVTGEASTPSLSLYTLLLWLYYLLSIIRGDAKGHTTHFYSPQCGHSVGRIHNPSSRRHCHRPSIPTSSHAFYFVGALPRRS